ncbi:MAG: hypothetical protein ACYC35_00625 [Pirellulales bacterium]
MAQTGKLGIADSLLGNVLLAFAGADDPLPSTGTMSGKLGTPASMLGNAMPALSGPDGPKVINLWAESTLVLVSSVSCDAEIVPHAPPAWVMGSPDWQLGDAQLGLTGADDPLPTIGTRSGRLGLGLGNLVLGLDGTVGAKVVYLSAGSTLALVSAASCDAEIVPHASPRWVLGGIDNKVGNTQLAYVEVLPRPLTGTMTGKLGTLASLLGNMRPALGEQEGDSGAHTYNVTAGNTLSLTQEASYAAIFARDASSTLSLTDSALLTRIALVSADSTLTLSDESTCDVGQWLHEVAAESVLELTTEATTTVDAWVFDLTADSTLELSDAATVTTRTWLHEVLADSTIELTQEANAALGNVIVASADSVLSMSVAATGELGAVYEVDADSTLSLATESDATTGVWLHEESAGSTIALTHAVISTAVRNLSAGSTLILTDQALGVSGHEYDLDAESWIELSDGADTLKTLNLRATSPLSLTHNVVVARPWYLSAETVLQETHQEFVPGTLDIIEVTTGLSTSASVNTMLNLGAHSVLGLSQRAGFAFIPPGGIIVSAGNTLELDQNAWNSQLASAASTLGLTQSLAVQVGKPLGSELDLAQSAGVTVVRNRSTESELELGQTVTYVLIRHGAVQLFDYAPATGGGPIPAALQGPFPGVTSRFALIYPASGPATDTIELQPPNLGNKDRLSFDRINRETRGGTLTVFADPNWPKVQTLVLSFSALYREEAYELIRFIRQHLGLEVKLSDWEQRVWKGVITKPGEPVVQDGKNSFTASFEFEGELLSA